MGENSGFEVLLNGRQLLGLLLAVLLLMTVAFLMGQSTTTAVAAAIPRATQPAPISSVPPDAHTPAPTAVASEPPAAPTGAPPKTEATIQPGPETATGMYLQVAAGEKADAESFTRRLAEKSFAVRCLPVVEKPGLFRVLVGPFEDSLDVAKAREELNKAGFRGQTALLRTF